MYFSIKQKGSQYGNNRGIKLNYTCIATMHSTQSWMHAVIGWTKKINHINIEDR